MVEVRDLRGIAGLGLADDANAHPASPRQVLIVGASDLRELSIEGHHLRANIVLDGDVKSLPSGALLAIGSVQLRITIFCEPCALLDREHPGLFKEVGARRGMLARIVASGSIHVGDHAQILDQRAVGLPRDWKQRVGDILAAVPPRETITYRQLARTAGVDRAFVRAIPMVLRTLANRGVPVDRVIRGAASSLPTWDAQPYFAE